MQADGSNISSGTNAPTSKRTTTQDKVRLLKVAQDQLWAILGLKMALDKLESLKYDVVVVQDDGGCTTIKVHLRVPFDFATGNIDGKDIIGVQNELEKQIKDLEGVK